MEIIIALDVCLDRSSITYFQGVLNKGFVSSSDLQVEGNFSGSFCSNYFHPDLPDQISDVSVYKPVSQPPGPGRVKDQFYNLVFDVETGLLAVATENEQARAFETDEEFLIELTSRVQNTVCFILNPETYDPLKNPLRLREPFSRIICGDWDTPCEEMQTHYKMRDFSLVYASHIMAVLAPFHLVDSIQRVFGETILIIPVPDRKTKINLGLNCYDTAPSRKDPLLEHYVTLIAPDYQSALEELITKRPCFLETGFYTHLSRLHPHRLPEQTEGQRKFVVRFGPGDIEKVRAVQSLFPMIKNPSAERLNEFYVICHEGEEIMTLRKFATTRPLCKGRLPQHENSEPLVSHPSEG